MAVMAVLWCALLVVVLAALVVRRRKFTSGFKFPGPRALPIIGNSLSLLGSRQDFFSLCSRLGVANPGGIFQLWVGMRPFVFLYDRHIIKPLVTSSNHIEKNFEYTLANEWLGNGLITSKGEDWLKQRKMLTWCFHFNVLKQTPPTIWKHGRVLLEKLEASRTAPVDIVPFTKLLALDIICETSMGIDIGTQVNLNSEYPAAISRIADILTYRFITPLVKPKIIFDLTPSGREYNKLLAKVHSFTEEVIQKRKQELQMTESADLHRTLDFLNHNTTEEDNEETLLNQRSFKKEVREECPEEMCKDCNRPACIVEEPVKKKNSKMALLDLLLKMSQNDQQITDKDIKDQVNTFMFAGHDTISTAVSFTLFILGHHPEWQERIAEELECECPDLFVSEPDSRLFTKGLPVLDRCIKEALRLYPPAPMVGRTIRSPLVTPKGTLPEGTTAIIYIYQLHRDPTVFPEPDRFDPDRFLPEHAPQDPFSYIPFSAGPRNCIGKSLALLEMKIILAMVLKRFKVNSLQSREELDLSFEIVLTNVKGIHLQFTPRNVSDNDQRL